MLSARAALPSQTWGHLAGFASKHQTKHLCWTCSIKCCIYIPDFCCHSNASLALPCQGTDSHSPGNFTRAPLELLPSPWLPGLATPQLHPISSHMGRRQRCENAGTRTWGSRGIRPGTHRNVKFLLENSHLGRRAGCWCKGRTLVSPQCYLCIISGCMGYLTVNQSLIFVLHVQPSSCSCRQKIPKGLASLSSISPSTQQDTG